MAEQTALYAVEDAPKKNDNLQTHEDVFCYFGERKDGEG